MKFYIEDLICRLGNSGQYMFDSEIALWEMDRKVVTNLAQNPSIGRGYTEKQRALVLRLCQKYKNQLALHLGAEVHDALDNPEFRFPVLEPATYEKSISVRGKEIVVKFPYNEELVGKIRKYRDLSNMRLCEWDADEKVWKFALEESNVSWIAHNIVNLGFSVDEEFAQHFEKIAEILEKIEDHIPMVVHDGEKFSFKNVFHTVPQPESNDLVQTLLQAKYYGISTWDENVEKMKENANFSPILTSFLQESKPNSLEFDLNENPVDQLKDLFKYNLPALIIIPGVNEFFTLKAWTLWLKNQGISEKDISVLFRLPNSTGNLLNEFVRQENINNPVAENTKIVFISQKMPKPLIKSSIEFKLILNLGSISGVHYSISTFLDGRPDVIRYTDKNRIGHQFGLL